MGSTVERMLRVLSTISLMTKSAQPSTSAADVTKSCTYNQNSTRAYISWLKKCELIANQDSKNYRVTELGQQVLNGELELRTSKRSFVVRRNEHKGELKPVEVVKRDTDRRIGANVHKPIPPATFQDGSESIITPWDPSHSMGGHAYHRRPKK